jgi:23S rRNA pseudouridine1911/1915/1917 synthase
VDGRQQKPSYSLRGGESVSIEPEAPPALRAFAEDLPIPLLHVDDDVIAIDKPAGMVVHAGAGRHSGTVVNALLHKFGQLSSSGGEERPGIVHRLDRDTSGVLLVARNDSAHRALAAQFAARQVEKVYLALVQGQMSEDSGTIDNPITRDPVRRTRMTARLAHGRSAVTDWKVLQRFKDFSFLEVRIGTGRTHQIRVHLSNVGHPIAGDTLYGAKAQPWGRFFLHAHRIRWRHPRSGEIISVESPLPEPLTAWLGQLELA